MKNKYEEKMQEMILHLFFCAPLSVSHCWESILPTTGKAPFLLLGKRLSCYWESVFPATGKASFLLLGKRLSCYWESTFPNRP